MLIKKIYLTFILLLSNFLISSDADKKTKKDPTIYVKLKIQVNKFKKFGYSSTHSNFYFGEDSYYYILNVSAIDIVAQLRFIALEKIKGRPYGDKCRVGLLTVFETDPKSGEAIVFDEENENQEIASFKNCLVANKNSEFEGDHFLCVLLFYSDEIATSAEIDDLQAECRSKGI